MPVGKVAAALQRCVQSGCSVGRYNKCMAPQWLEQLAPVEEERMELVAGGTCCGRRAPRAPLGLPCWAWVGSCPAGVSLLNHSRICSLPCCRCTRGEQVLLCKEPACLK